VETYQFEAVLQSDQCLRVPAEVAQALPAGQVVRVVLLVGDDKEDEDWKRFAMDQLFKGYGEEDDAYDQLPTG
jgi:hypothetical protein